jgi:predicted ferric reductase
MAITQIIATRIFGIEPLFGPLDRSYILHKWLGIGAMTAILLHDTVDAEMNGHGAETILSERAETWES